MTVKIPMGKSIARKYRQHFTAQANNMLAQLELYHSAQLASNF